MGLLGESVADCMKTSGTDPENIEPGGATVQIIRLNRGAQFFFCLTYKSEQGGVRRVRPLLIRAWTLI